MGSQNANDRKENVTDHLHRRCSALVHCTKVSLTKDTTIFIKSPTITLYLGLQIRDCCSNIVTSGWQSWLYVRLDTAYFAEN